jgi:uncharacterized protein YecT (DUF1311 family)
MTKVDWLAGKEVEGGSMESVLISDCFLTRTEEQLIELKRAKLPH